MFEVERFESSALEDKETKETWEFNMLVDPYRIWLIRYRKQFKTHRQRAWRTDQFWDTYNKRENSLREPPLPLEVAQEAKEKIKQTVDGLKIEVRI